MDVAAVEGDGMRAHFGLFFFFNSRTDVARSSVSPIQSKRKCPSPLVLFGPRVDSQINDFAPNAHSSPA